MELPGLLQARIEPGTISGERRREQALDLPQCSGNWEIVAARLQVHAPGAPSGSLGEGIVRNRGVLSALGVCRKGVTEAVRLTQPAD